MATVIDSLIVTLGLDPTEFKKGTRETEKQIAGTEKKVRDSSDSMGKSIARMARQFTVAFLGLKGVQGLINLNHTAAQIGVLSENTGVATEKLNAFQEALRIQTGGEAGSADNALKSITQQQTNQRTQGFSDWEQQLNRLQLSLTGAGNASKDTLEFFYETADALKQMADSSPGGRKDAYNIGASLGWDENAVNLALQGGKAVRAEVEAQERKFKLTKAMAGDAKKTEQAIDNLKVSAEHVFQELLNKLRPFILEFTAWLTKVSGDPAVLAAAADGLTILGKGIQFFVDVVKLAVRGWSNIMNTDVGKFVSKMIGEGAARFHEFVSQDDAKPTEGASESPPSVLNRAATSLIGAVDFSEDAKSIAAIPHTVAEWFGGFKLPDIGAYNARKHAEFIAEDKRIASYKAAQATAKAARDTTRNGPTTNSSVHIDNMTVTTQAKDARGVADGMHAAIKDKHRRVVDQATGGTR